MYEAWADRGFDRELRALPAATRSAVEDSLGSLRESPLEHPQVARLHGSGYTVSFRFRVGQARVLGLILAGPQVILLTTVFVKKRASDYDAALVRHETRLRAQGPPLAEFVQKARKWRL